MASKHELAREVRKAKLAEIEDGQVRVLGGVRREVPCLDLMPAHLDTVEVLHACNLRRGLGHRARVAQLLDLRLLAHVHGRGGGVEQGERERTVVGIGVVVVEVHRAVAVLRAADGERVVVVRVRLALQANPRGGVGELRCGGDRRLLEQRDVAPYSALCQRGLWQPLHCGCAARSAGFARPWLGGGRSTR